MIVDRKVKSRFFRLYDINTCELLFQTELYINFADKYIQVNDKFYCFPIISAVIGVEFSNLNDARAFEQLVEKFCFSGDPKHACKEEKKRHGIK